MTRYFHDDEIIGLNPGTVEKLDAGRGYAGVPFWIVSGLRTETHNADVGGKKNSAHLRGYAVDLRAISSETKFKIVTGLLRAGFTRLGIYKMHIHADDDPALKQGVLW